MTETRIHGLPEQIGHKCQSYFGPALVQSGIRLFKSSKVSISFKKGSSDSYFVVSGIVRDSRSHEVKIVYKRRFEGTPEGPLSSNCDCFEWNHTKHCSHAISLYIAYLINEYVQNQNGDSAIIAGNEHASISIQNTNLPPIALDSNLGVSVAEYGTIITGPGQLIGASSGAIYSSLQYLLHNKRVVNFPLPENLNGKLELCLYHNDRFRFKLKLTGAENSVAEISILESQYVFDWKNGNVYNLPSDLKNLIQKLKTNQFQHTINDILGNIQELDLFSDLLISIENVELSKIKSCQPHCRFTMAPANKKGLLHVEIEFYNNENLLVIPNDFLSLFTYHSQGIFSHFKKKQESLNFLSSVKLAITNNNDQYKKLIVTSPKKGKAQILIEEIKRDRDSILYDQELSTICNYHNSIIRGLYLAFLQCFGDNFFRYAHLDLENKKLKYDVPPNTIFQGLAEFHKICITLGIEIFYDRHEISKWNSKIRFERRSSDTRWFDLELSIDQNDLELIQQADLENGMIITNKGLILLSKEDEDLIRFMHKYTKFEANDSKEIIEEGRPFKKFILPFNRARIFELFELQRLGITGALTEDDIKLCQNLSQLAAMPTYPLPANLEGILRPYQIVGYNWLRFLYEHKLGACLADDMGLGKTLQAISFLQSVYDKIQRVLIVCPVTILLNWEKEIQKFSNMELSIFHGGSREFAANKKIILTSYGVMKKESEAIFSNYNFDILILDEVQHLKNIRSLGAFSARKINANFRICLTGTPVENDLSEFYNILDLSVPGIWGDLQFVRTLSSSKTRLIARKTASPFILRRTKSQVLHDLPPKIENNIYLNFSADELRSYQNNIVTIRTRIENSSSTSKYGEILRGLLQLRQNCLWQNPSPVSSQNYKSTLSTKISFLMETLETILEENEQAIIFSQFTTYLDIIELYFKEKHWKFSRIDGSQSINKRQEQVEYFQSGRNPIFLISLKAGGVGLNLTAASFVFIMDPWWNPAVESQAIDRAHRIGQKNTLTVYRPIIKGSVEEKVLKLQEEKKQLFSDLLSTENDDQTFSGRLTMKDFESLIY